MEQDKELPFESKTDSLSPTLNENSFLRLNTSLALPFHWLTVILKRAFKSVSIIVTSAFLLEVQ